MSKAKIVESGVEEAALEYLVELGYAREFGPNIAYDGEAPERSSYSDVMLNGRLRSALAKLNPKLGADALDDVMRKLTRLDNPNIALANHDFHKLLIEGVPFEYRDKDGVTRTDSARLFDFDKPSANEWLAVNQFTIIEGGKNRRPDIVIFVNGLPLGVIELKNVADENATIKGAFNQLQTYKQDIPSLFTFNEALVISDGTNARIGTLTADWERFMPWRTIEGKDVAPAGSLEMETLLKGVFAPERFLDLIRYFVVFNIDKANVIKKVAGYHQFHAVNKAVACTVKASSPKGDKRVGVVWHTQGSGKSLSMVFYAGKVIQQREMENPTLIILTDRNDLDDQLFDTFSACHELLRQRPVHAQSRTELRKLLKVASGGVIFTTIQKFGVSQSEKMPLLSERRNIIFIADEAHRSQYGFTEGFARHLRDALPNASFIGFTGTPIESSDKSTPAVFGNYIDVYDIQRAVEDGATVRIFYEARLAKLNLNEDLKDEIDEDFDSITESEDEKARLKLKSKWARLEAIIGSEKRVKLVAKDIVEHFEQRLSAMDGKAMIVAMSRRIAAELYNEIVRLRPKWASKDDKKGFVKVVMTGSAADPLDWQAHIRNKQGRDAIAHRFKDEADPLKLVIVRDMWLTGFDVPSLHTMYVDKPMRGHGLMQAIARVNRVFKDKPGGLVVDYLGIADQLKRALLDYSESDRHQVGIDQQEAVDALKERYEVLKAMLHGFDYSAFFSESHGARIKVIPAAMEHVFAQKDGKKRFMEGVAALSQAFALAVPDDEALALRDEVIFLQAVRAAIAKNTTGTEKTEEELDAAVRQIISKAVSSDEVVDIFKAAGLNKPDISILSDEFLAEMRGMPQKNLAVEALAKLLKDQIKSRFATNIVQERAFSEMLEKSVKRYQNRAIEAAQIIEELIALAKELRDAGGRGQELGLSDDEVAFYDALAENNSAKEVLGIDELRAIARILVERVKNSVSIDWAVRESVRAKLRVMVKRILNEHGYPPDLQAAATELVLRQAERLSEHWLKGS